MTVISTLLQPGSAAGTVVDQLTRRRLLSGGIGAAAPLVIPRRPQRIVSTWGYGAAARLEAGASVVGMPLSTEPLFEEDLAARHNLGDVIDIGTVDALDVELVASLTPDLVIVAVQGGEPTADEATLDRLRAIAPVVQLEGAARGVRRGPRRPRDRGGRRSRPPGDAAARGDLGRPAGQVVVVDYAVWGFAVVDALFVVLDDVERILAENDVTSVGDFREGTGS
jgi:hypothetical protein